LICVGGDAKNIDRSSEDIRLKTAIQEEEKEKHKADAGKIKSEMRTGYEPTYSNVNRS
jgi:hypothetical protein